MRIDGKAIAEAITTDLSHKTSDLLSRGITPTLAVILVGDDPASLAYIRQKNKAAERIGARVVFDHQSADINADTLANLVKKYNTDSHVHGLIVQRPVPKSLGDVTEIINSVVSAKDVDGFVPDSPFPVPVAAAVGEMVRSAYHALHATPWNPTPDAKETDAYRFWLKDKHVVVIGRGDTAGEPIYRYFQKQHCTTSQIHSQTPDPHSVMRSADILISCVGKERVVTAGDIKPGTILIGVGIRRNSEGKLKGDYEESEIEMTAGAYTSTPGGVGPVNVACLMKNLIHAAGAS